MQKCSLCGGRVINGRCEECGMPIPPEHTYTLRGESAHYHRVNGEDVLHRVRPRGSRPMVDGYDEESGQFYGRTFADSPDIDGRVWIASDEPVHEGDFVMVKIDGCTDGDLCGYVVEEEA